MQQTPPNVTKDRTKAQNQQTPPIQETPIHGPEVKTEAQIQRAETPQRTEALSRWKQLQAHVFGENKTDEAQVSEMQSQPSEIHSRPSGIATNPAEEFPV